MFMDWFPEFSTGSITQNHSKVIFLKLHITSAIKKSNNLVKIVSKHSQVFE